MCSHLPIGSPYLILMIKRAGDWTNDLIRLLYEWKWHMMKMGEINFDEYEQYDVFNTLHDLHQEIPLREVVTRNKMFYPKVKIGRACSTPNETFIERKNIILVGAGSGISPYLPLLEEVIRYDKGKSNAFEKETSRIIFIAREGEQISWVSNYLFHIISSQWILPSLELYIFITLNKDLKTLASFLFWRAFLLIQSQKSICVRKKEDAVKIRKKFMSSDQYVNPIKVMFGRPDFEKLFKTFADKETSFKDFYVYSTSSAPLNEAIFAATKKVNKNSHCKFHHIYEATS